LLTLRVIDLLYLVMIAVFACVALFALMSSFTLIRIGPAARLGARMGQYKLVRKIAEGGIGEIYLARHEFLKRPTAIKILKPDRNDPESLKRFENEVRATSQLSHHNTVAIYDYGRTADRNFYYAMEYLPGISLARLIELENCLPPHRTIYLLQQICASLKEAHGLGHIHRDIKPLNIMVSVVGGEYDVIKVVDFGLVKSVKSLLPAESTDALPASLRGTPACMAPELLLNPAQANVCTDIYSLGVVAYKMLSGQNLFESVYEAGLFYDILHTPPRPLDELQPQLPPVLTRLVMQCIEKDPMRRPPHVGEIASQLAQIPLTTPWTQTEARQWWELRDHLLLLAE
jgi:serine/threonine protein kinase